METERGLKSGNAWKPARRFTGRLPSEFPKQFPIVFVNKGKLQANLMPWGVATNVLTDMLLLLMERDIYSYDSRNMHLSHMILFILNLLVWLQNKI
jgi:hypothetical protein